MLLAGSAVALWPWTWSDAEREHHTLAATWAQARPETDQDTPWDRYAAWARSDEDAVELVLIRRAGTATGFGLAVYILGDDGYVTVYGHVNRYFVSTGERVSAGEQIAEVGNRGQSTGPHLHFEVHPRGVMYGGQTNPVPWLNARGVYLGGCGG